MDNVEISLLTDPNCDCFKKIIAWQYALYGESEDESFEHIEENFRNSLNTDCLPVTYVARINNLCVGYFNITHNDLDIRPQYHPWLANVYVDAAYRGIGICKKLIEHAIEYLKNNGYKKCYLYTHHVDFYEKFGFKLIEIIDPLLNKPHDKVRVYKIDLTI